MSNTSFWFRFSTMDHRRFREHGRAESIDGAIHAFYERFKNVHPDEIEISLPGCGDGYAFSLTLIVWIGGSYQDDPGEWVCTLYVPIGDKRFPDGRLLIGRRRLGETDIVKAFHAAMAEAQQAIRTDREFMAQGGAAPTHSGLRTRG